MCHSHASIPQGNQTEARFFLQPHLCLAPFPRPSLLLSLPEGFLLEHFIIKSLAKESLAQALLVGSMCYATRLTDLLRRLNESVHVKKVTSQPGT